MLPDDARVSFVCAVRHLAGVHDRLYTVGEPLVEPLPDGERGRVEHDAPRRVAHSFGETAFHVLFLAPVDVFALRAVRGLCGVHPLKQPVLTLRDPVACRRHYRAPDLSFNNAPSSFRIFFSIRAAVLSRPTRRVLSTSSRHAAKAASGVACSPRCTSTLNLERREPGLPVIS